MLLRFLQDHGMWHTGQLVELYAGMKELIDLGIAEAVKPKKKIGRPKGSRNKLKPKNAMLKNIETKG